MTDPDIELLDACIARLMERFETCQIFVSRYENAGTEYKGMGRGNAFARRGQVSEWLCKETETDREEARQGMRREND